eukprot:6188273-Pleurochrysis_carterae.AAC.3
MCGVCSRYHWPRIPHTGQLARPCAVILSTAIAAGSSMNYGFCCNVLDVARASCVAWLAVNTTTGVPSPNNAR